MLSGPALAAVLRKSHYQLKRFASDLHALAQPYQIAERSALGPTWHYGEDADPVRYHDGQCLVLADGRAVMAELQVVFEQNCVTVNGWLSVEEDEDDDLGNGGVSELLIDSGPRWARSDEETVAAIAETVSEIIPRASILHELGIPARQQ
jgi:hypothetical protein